MVNIFEALKGMKDMQKHLSSIRVEGRAGGDMVIIAIDGKFQPKKVTISPEALENKNPEFVADLVSSALKDAVSKVQSELQARLGGGAGGSMLQGMFGGGG